MKKFYKRMTMFALIFLGISFSIVAQITVKQAVVCNGGLYESANPTDWVTVQTVSPTDYSIIVFDTIYTQSVQSVVVQNSNAWVAAQDSLVSYDLDSYNRIAAVGISGASLICVENNVLVLTRQYPATENFVQIYNATTLELIQEISGVSGEAAGSVIFDGYAYVGVNFGYAGTAGTIAKINLTDYSVEEINLGAGAKGISTLIIDEQNIFTINNTPYGGTTGSITNFDIETNTFETTEITGVVSKGFGIKNGELYFGLNNGVSSFDITTNEITEILPNQGGANSLTIAGGAFDIVNDNIWFTLTDYYSMGEGKVFNLSGELVSDFTAGISAEAISFQYIDETSVAAIEKEELVAYPNPFNSHFEVNVSENSNISLFSADGRLVFSEKGSGIVRISTDDLISGFYFLKVETDGIQRICKMIKR